MRKKSLLATLLALALLTGTQAVSAQAITNPGGFFPGDMERGA